MISNFFSNLTLISLNTSFGFLELLKLKELSHYADYFNKCRNKRNDIDYDRALVVSEKEKTEIINIVKDFLKLLKNWPKLEKLLQK